MPVEAASDVAGQADVVATGMALTAHHDHTRRSAARATESPRFRIRDLGQQAHREDAPEHDRYADWLPALTESDEPFALSDAVLTGFLRIVTSPRIFDPPTPMDTAITSASDWWTGRAHHRLPSRRHLDVFVFLCRAIKGPLVADTYIAALAIEHGCELITTNGDFAHFPGLRWRQPLAAPK